MRLWTLNISGKLRAMVGASRMSAALHINGQVKKHVRPGAKVAKIHVGATAAKTTRPIPPEEQKAGRNIAAGLVFQTGASILVF